MSTVATSDIPDVPQRSTVPMVPLLAIGALALALLALILPTLLYLSQHIWSGEEQGHGPIIGAVVLWLMWRRRGEFLAAAYRPRPTIGGVILLLALMAYAIGRSQLIIQIEFASLIALMAGLIIFFRGFGALKVYAFPLFFLIFMVPFPGVLVQAITIPLKSGVSVVAEAILYKFGYPIARSGVILSIGQYQLLVADACAGLNSMFTLEALGLLYLNLMGYASRIRNVALALMVIPISFAANVVRVVILVLVTYYLGDAAGQGFVHSFAGMILFGVGLMIMITADGLLARLLGQSGEGRKS